MHNVMHLHMHNVSVPQPHLGKLNIVLHYGLHTFGMALRVPHKINTEVLGKVACKNRDASY